MGAGVFGDSRRVRRGPVINHGNAGNQTKDTESTTQMAEMPGRSPANSATTPEISTKITQISGVPAAFSGRNDRGFGRALRTFGPRASEGCNKGVQCVVR